MPWTGPRLELAVGCSGLSASRSDWLVEKATELGAHSLRPLLCQRSSSVLGERLPRNAAATALQTPSSVVQAASPCVLCPASTHPASILS